MLLIGVDENSTLWGVSSSCMYNVGVMSQQDSARALYGSLFRWYRYVPSLVSWMFLSWAVLWLHAAPSGLVLWHGHSQSFHQLCSQQREQHALRTHRHGEHCAHTDKRKQRRSCPEPSTPLLHSFLPFTCWDAFHFPPPLPCMSTSCCIHSNFFYRLTMNHFFVWTFFFSSYLVELILSRPCVFYFVCSICWWDSGQCFFLLKCN